MNRKATLLAVVHKMATIFHSNSVKSWSRFDRWLVANLEGWGWSSHSSPKLCQAIFSRKNLWHHDI